MQEGVGYKYKKADRASEDHININGEVYKLDQTLIEFKADPNRPGGTDQEYLDVHMQSLTGDKAIFPSNRCEMTFTPEKNFTDGVNLILVAFRRYWKLGHYDINCTIDGKEINVPKARGMFEHVWSSV